MENTFLLIDSGKCRAPRNARTQKITAAVSIVPIQARPKLTSVGKAVIFHVAIPEMWRRCVWVSVCVCIPFFLGASLYLSG